MTRVLMRPTDPLQSSTNLPSEEDTVVELEDTHRVPLTRDCGAPEFARDILESVPRWLLVLLQI